MDYGTIAAVNVIILVAILLPDIKKLAAKLGVSWATWPQWQVPGWLRRLLDFIAPGPPWGWVATTPDAEREAGLVFDPDNTLWPGYWKYRYHQGEWLVKPEGGGKEISLWAAEFTYEGYLEQVALREAELKRLAADSEAKRLNQKLRYINSHGGGKRFTKGTEMDHVLAPLVTQLETLQKLIGDVAMSSLLPALTHIQQEIAQVLRQPQVIIPPTHINHDFRGNTYCHNCGMSATCFSLYGNPCVHATGGSTREVPIYAPLAYDEHIYTDDCYCLRCGYHMNENQPCTPNVAR